MKTSGAAKTLALVLGGMTGKALGLTRDIALAYFFGANRAADAFRVSLLAALVPTHFFMGDVLSSAFVPLYMRYRGANPASAFRLLRVTSAYLLGVALVLVVVIWFSGGTLIRLVAPGLATETHAVATRMIRWMGLGVPFYCIAALLALYGTCVGRFRPIALGPAFQNAGLVVAIPIAAWLRDPEWIGLGFAGAFALYLAYVFWELRHTESLVHSAAIPGGGGGGGGGDELRALYRTAAPLLYIMVLGQLLAVVDRIAASFVGVGAIASLEYARVFVETPHVLVGTAIATTALSRYSGLEQQAVMAKATRVMLALLSTTLGVMIVVAAAAPELVRLLYQRGRFDATAALNVTLAVRGLAFGGAFMTAAYVMNRVLSAQLRNRESIMPMAVCVLVAAGANVALAPRLGVLGVGLAMTLAYATLCALLAMRLGIWRLLLHRLPPWIAGGGMVALVLYLVQLMQPTTLVRLVCLCAGGAVAWGGGLWLFADGRADLRTLKSYVGVIGDRT